MAAPKSVYVQDKPVAVYNFPTSVVNDAVDEINEVKAELLVSPFSPCFFLISSVVFFSH